MTSATKRLTLEPSGYCHILRLDFDVRVKGPNISLVIGDCEKFVSYTSIKRQNVRQIASIGCVIEIYHLKKCDLAHWRKLS